MPTYEYVCSACGNAWEEMQKITEAPLEECPRCHKATAKRQISGGSFILKGGGWYADLYSSSSKKSDASSSSGSTETKKTETKAESSASPSPAPAPATPSKSAAE